MIRSEDDDMKYHRVKTMMMVLVILIVYGVMEFSIDLFAISQARTDEIINIIDDRQRNTGDYKALCYIQNSEEGHEDVLYESVIYRRDSDDAFVILFTRPRDEAGKCYLRIEDNLWFYDPTTGKWERRTERESIVGTNSRRSDLDESRLSEEYNATFVAEESLGRYQVYHFKLEAKQNIDVAYPIIEIWVDTETLNILKAQDFALSGRLMRTSYYPSWKRVYSESKGDYVYYPEEIRIFDEIETGNSTIIKIDSVDLRSLEANIFTKAWIEAQSR